MATVDPADLVRTEEAFRLALAHPGPALVVARRACVLVERDQYRGVRRVEEELCSLCNLCLRLGCPAISRSGETVVIDPTLCEGCSLCVAVCPTDAIVNSAENADGK
ncbi:4Fe-4S dicluster domain-containing protein [candidate division KSB1 bacterium]